MTKDEYAKRTAYLEKHGLAPALAASVTSIPGVNQRRCQQLAKLGVYSVLDLLRYFPKRYEDWQASSKLSESTAKASEQVLIGQLVSPLRLSYKGRLSYIRSQLDDGTGRIDVIWFNQPWLVKQLHLNTTYVFRGKIKQQGYRASLQNPRVKAYHENAVSESKLPVELAAIRSEIKAKQAAAKAELANFTELVNGERTASQIELATPENIPLYEPAFSATDEANNDVEAELRKTHVANQPVYGLTANLSNVNLQTLQAKALKQAIEYIPEILPAWLKEKYKLADSKFTYEQIHFPKDEQSLALARRRLAFEELFLLQLALQTLHRHDASKQAERVLLTDADKQKLAQFEQALPFTLTKGQSEAKDTILADLAAETACNRLLQGDTGSGKTVVAAYAMLACYLAGKQAVLMAPTQILAKQHYDSLRKLWQNCIPEAKIALATGNLTAKNRRELAKKIAQGEVSLVIGTHAVLNEKWQWPALALAVTDEQHRFGVNQRLSFLHDKQLYPHLLVMSATPIPRSLALVLYGDLNISVIAERPAKRKKILTYMANNQKMPKIYEYLQMLLAQGSQAYWICPLVKEDSSEASEETENGDTSKQASDLMAASTRQAKLQADFPELNIGLVHGKLKDAEKNQIMADFYAGKIDVLVATTVVEVGVDNPNANFMVIENAERFGLAQLHQLRGRVGRSDKQALCILLSEQASLKAKQANSIAYQRLVTLCSSDDGFYLANQDLKLRGPGDFFGVRQHGLPEFKLANLYDDKELIAETQAAVQELLKQDADLSSDDAKYLQAAIAWYYPDLEDNVVL